MRSGLGFGLVTWAVVTIPGMVMVVGTGINCEGIVGEVTGIIWSISVILPWGIKSDETFVEHNLSVSQFPSLMFTYLSPS